MRVSSSRSRHYVTRPLRVGKAEIEDGDLIEGLRWFGCRVPFFRGLSEPEKWDSATRTRYATLLHLSGSIG